MAENNTRNTDSNLFKRLTRLFSGPIVGIRTQDVRRMRRHQYDKYQYQFRDTSGRQFKKSSYDPFSNITSKYIASQNRRERYGDFDQMEYTPESASALDIYADEMTTSTPMNPMIRITCPNEEIHGILKNLYHDILNVEYNLFGWSRSMCKFGDFFLYLDIDEDHGITNAIGLPTPDIERLEGEDKTNPNYVQYQWNSAGITMENWQVAHFRVLGNDKYAPYGSSVLEAARRIWRQLTLIEDAMMAYRIVRSPERRVFKIEVGNISPQDVEQYIERVKTQMKRNQVVDQDTGRVDLRYNPLSVEEDYFIPVRGGQGSDITSLPGGTYTGDIDDVKYLRDKLFSALKIPQAYLASTEGGEEGKTTLAQKDIRFARTIQRLQRSITSELEKVGIVHLYTLGFRDDDLLSFRLHLNSPSKIAELQELENWRVKFEVAAAANEGYFSRRWVATQLFGMSEEQLIRNQRELFYDKTIDAQLEAVAEQVAMESEAAGGGEEEFEEEEMGEEAGEEVEDEEGAEDETLLAAPGNRDDWMMVRKSDGARLSDSSRGKIYVPEERDGREIAGNRRKMKGSYSAEAGSSTRRNVFPGMQGFKESNYKKDESNVLNLRHEIKKLVENLENKVDEKDKKSS